MIYLFSYETSFNLFQSTEPLIKEIKSFPGWCQCFEKTWLIASKDDIKTVDQKFRQHLKQNDLSLLVQIDYNSYYGWLPNEVWDWINNSRSSGF